MLLPHADRALAWIAEHGDRDGDGFVEYERMSERGLVNQGWKDSWDGVNFIDGRLAEAPVALAEVQGYVYGAYCARAALAERLQDPRTASDYRERAQRLRTLFDDAFWLASEGYYAVALDRDKQPVDSLGSNMGHCLWTGIVAEDRAAEVAARLLADDMFSGWGVRTLATGMARYNPMSYHNGSVWPHDNALIAGGLSRYGYRAEARRITVAMLEAAAVSDGRLPELFCGFAREDFPQPLPYPTSCSPQAWASATPVHLLRVMLGLDPGLPAGRRALAPHLAAELGSIEVDNLPLGPARVRLRARVPRRRRAVCRRAWQSRPRTVPSRRRSPASPTAGGSPPGARVEQRRLAWPQPLGGRCAAKEVLLEDHLHVGMVVPPYHEVPPVGYGGIEATIEHQLPVRGARRCPRPRRCCFRSAARSRSAWS